MTPSRFADRFLFYSNQPQQQTGVAMLYNDILSLAGGSDILTEDAAWAVEFSNCPAPAAPAVPEIGHAAGGEVVTSANFSPNSPFSLRITPNITYGEVCLYQEARRFVAEDQCDMAIELCVFAQRCRDQFPGSKLIITSGNRPPAVNASIGGATNSEHLYRKGEGALDIYLEGTSVWTLQDWMDQNWPYSLGYGAPRGFVHFGIRQGRPRVRWDY
jgi:hypothetical protein